MMLSVICITTGEVIHPQHLVYNCRLVMWGVIQRTVIKDLLSSRRRRLRSVLNNILTPADKPIIIPGRYYCPRCKLASLRKNKDLARLLPGKKTGISFSCRYCLYEYLMIIPTRRQG